MKLVDTHCHIHSTDYQLDSETAYARALESGVNKMICVGTDELDSQLAVAFAASHANAWATVGIHPHEAKSATSDKLQKIRNLLETKQSVDEPIDGKKIVAVGEIGLDYFYSHSSKPKQIALLEAQLQLAVDRNLPVIFHVRQAFDDFWPVYENFRYRNGNNVRGVLHSFTDVADCAKKAFGHGLYLGINGISTFTKDVAQKELYQVAPLENVLLETDAPYLTPTPYRGKINEPSYVRNVAKHLCELRSISIDEISSATTHSAMKLFGFK